MITIRYDIEPVKRAIRDLQKSDLPDAVVRHAEKKMLKHVAAKAPRRSGTFASSFKPQSTRGKRMRLITKYGALFRFLEYSGTQSHIIVPVKARVLHWIDPDTGKDMFRYRVRHPGTSPTPFARPGIRKVAPSALHDAFRDLTRRLPWLRVTGSAPPPS